MKSKINLIILFTLFSVLNSFAQITDNNIYTKVDEMPQFFGGSEKLYDYIFVNLNYPESARKEKIIGEVFTQFVIDIEGKVKDVKVIKGIHPDLDKEAIRIIQKMPKWIPGKKDGKNVNTMVSLPIKFSL